METKLAGKSVIVTGAGSNIGRAIALAFAKEGAHVTVADIDEKSGQGTADDAKQYGIVDHVISHRGELVEPTKQPSMTL